MMPLVANHCVSHLSSIIANPSSNPHLSTHTVVPNTFCPVGTENGEHSYGEYHNMEDGSTSWRLIGDPNITILVIYINPALLMFIILTNVSITMKQTILDSVSRKLTGVLSKSTWESTTLYLPIPTAN